MYESPKPFEQAIPASEWITILCFLEWTQVRKQKFSFVGNMNYQFILFIG